MPLAARLRQRENEAVEPHRTALGDRRGTQFDRRIAIRTANIANKHLGAAPREDARKRENAAQYGVCLGDLV